MARKAKTDNPQITWNCLPQQRRFLESTARETCYSGALGAGKTRSLLFRLVMRALKPGSREGLFRRHLVSLRATTLKTLLEPEGSLPPVLPEGTYSHHISNKTIHLIGGGSIVYGGLDDPQKIGSLNLSGVAIDEATEIDENIYTMLRGRCRLQVEGLSNAIYFSCNPSGPQHFIAQRFGLDGKSTPAPGCAAIRTKTADNFYLPAEYVDDLNTFTGVARQRYVEGLWVGSEGLIYDFDPFRHVRERSGPWVEVLGGCDWGFTSASCILPIAKDEGGGLHVLDEHYQSGQLESDLVAVAQRFRSQYGVSRFYIDPSAAALRETFRRSGLQAEPGDNDVSSGIMRVQGQFASDGTGKPLLTISPRCRNLQLELASYEWEADGKDKPRKQFDHAADALRYGVMAHTAGPGELKVYVIDPHQPSPAPAGDGFDPRQWTSFEFGRDDSPYRSLRGSRGLAGSRAWQR